MSTIADRVRARRNKLGLSQKELAKKIGVSQGTIGQLESGRNNSTKHIYQLAMALAVDVLWLLYGKPETLDETGKKANLSNTGVVSFPDAPIQFHSNFIRSLNLDETQLTCIQQTDDSMLPTIYNSDYILCDTAVKSLQENSIFRIKRNGKYITRRIVFDQTAAVIYRSDNPNRIQYQDIYALPTDEIIGKIVWAGGYQQFK